ncbi:hypothetical protein EDD29_3704 [Actinocorallia herbida]|uniref:DUF998 domain-containing protein n=1 Tax=Actinocorallia herbida TaxID=58109 RepID=A0A3N1CXZ5_9ACTN|nr:hypothetical protein [Actinocorallia herbida]ROO86141.1 hypothetical protein EDD29_3704 [Actinocorallia herbida]
MVTSVGVRGLGAGLVGGGGVLFAVGNVLHPLEHNAAAHAAATWEAAHLIFGLGGLLVAAGLPLVLAVGGVVRPSRIVMTGGVLFALAFAALGPGAWFEAFVAPLPGDVAAGLEKGAGGTVNAVAGSVWILAMLILGGGLARSGSRGSVRLAGAGLILTTVVMIGGPGIPVKEGLWIIPGTVVAGLSLVLLALAAVRRPERAAAEIPV